MKIRILFFLLWVILTAIPAPVWGKPIFKIALLMGPEGETLYHQQIVREVNTLLESRVNVEYLSTDISNQTGQVTSIISNLMNDDSIDCIIGIGFNPSELLVQYKEYNKPVIAATILDRKLQGLPITPEGSSGIHNFNYIQSPFDIEKDLRTFKTLHDYTHLAILLPADKTLMAKTLYSYFGRAAEIASPGSKLSIVGIDPDTLEQSVADIPLQVDAVYVIPLLSEGSEDEEKQLLQALNKRRLPSFALIGEEHVRMGAMAAIAPEQNFNAMTRRVAINVLDILDGRNAGTLPVTVSPYADNFVINARTLHQIDYYPSWKAMEEAHILNLDKLQQGPKINLKGVILESLERNLNLQIEKSDTQIQVEASDIAGSALMPQLNLSTSLTRVDKNRVKIAGTVAAQTTWSATGSVSQSIFSDDLLANYSIQKILLESQKYQEKALILDTVVTSAQAYINLLFAWSNQAIQNNNLDVTRKNLDIARNKAEVGSVDISEVHRWESEKASNQIRLNDAQRDFHLSVMALNQVLDRPITRKFTPMDIKPESGIGLLAMDPEINHMVDNFKDLERFSNFLILEADKNLPELRQIEQSLKSEKRRLLNRQRAIFLPDVTLTGSADKILGEYDRARKTSSDLDHPWTVALTANWPLFSGGSKKKELAQSRIQLNRIRMEEKDLRNRLHLNVRSNLETAAVSVKEIELAQNARVSANKSFQVTQAGYAEGRNSIADLVDAQNTMVNSERNAAIARYQFVIDFITLERSIGRFYFLDTPEEKQLFMTRLRDHMAVKPQEN